MEHSDVILQHSPMDDYILNILSGGQIEKNASTARANLLTNAQSFPDLRFIAAACFLKVGDLYSLEGNLNEAKSSYLKIAGDKSSDMTQYRVLAEERLKQTAQELALGDRVVLPSNRELSRASEPANEEEAANTLVVGGRARIVSRSGSNKMAIRVSLNSASTRIVDVGQTVTLIEQSPGNDEFRMRAEDGNVLGWIPKEELEPLGPAQE
jgi:hypothetical protein